MMIGMQPEIQILDGKEISKEILDKEFEHFLEKSSLTNAFEADKVETLFFTRMSGTMDGIAITQSTEIKSNGLNLILFVDPIMRKKGIGTALLSAVILAVKKLGFQYLIFTLPSSYEEELEFVRQVEPHSPKTKKFKKGEAQKLEDQEMMEIEKKEEGFFSFFENFCRRHQIPQSYEHIVLGTGLARKIIFNLTK